jgi:hypothetical protein
MKKFVIILIIISIFTAAYLAQRRNAAPASSTTPKSPAATATKPISDKGVVEGHTYRNDVLGFAITFPDAWTIGDEEFEATMKKQGFDLSLKAPATLTPAAQARMDQALKRVTVLVTAYRSAPVASDNAILRVSSEDLSSQPQIKDAVDYFDAIRQSYQAMKLPADFKYSGTQAERLGLKAFAYLDTSNKAGKKRMYATVKDGKAVLFTLSYTSDEDLQTMRRILTEGNFHLK